jgi:hypothetical protein
MVYLFVAVVVGIAACLLALAGFKMLLRRHWIGAWLRGTVGLALVAAALFGLLLAWDLHNFRQVLAERPVATLAFSRIGPRHFAVELVDANGNNRRAELHGELWQLDMRIVKWSDPLTRAGLRPGYQLDRLGGRYLSLEDERNQQRSVIDLSERDSVVDAWQWLRRMQRWLPIVDAQYGSATYQPMADGALFAVSMGPSGPVARPINERARVAVERWQ